MIRCTTGAVSLLPVRHPGIPRRRVFHVGETPGTTVGLRTSRRNSMEVVVRESLTRWQGRRPTLSKPIFVPPLHLC